MNPRGPVVRPKRLSSYLKRAVKWTLSSLEIFVEEPESVRQQIRIGISDNIAHKNKEKLAETSLTPLEVTKLLSIHTVQ